MRQALYLVTLCVDLWLAPAGFTKDAGTGKVYLKGDGRITTQNRPPLRRWRASARLCGGRNLGYVVVQP